MLSNQWTVPNFYSIDCIPPASDSPPTQAAAPDLSTKVLQGYLDRLADGSASLGPVRVHRLEDIREAHLDLEHNRTFGKHVVLTHL